MNTPALCACDAASPNAPARFVRLACALLGAGLISLSPLARGQELIANGGFELPGFTPAPDYYLYLAPSLSTANAIANWTVTFNGGSEASYWMRAGGPYDSMIGAGSYGVLLHEGDTIYTSFSATSGITYAVSFLAFTQADWPTGTIGVTAAGHFASFTPTTSFATYSFNFTAATTGPATLVFEPDHTNVNQWVVLDSVSVMAVPEPSAYALGAGLLGLLGAAWRRRRQMHRA